MSEIKAFFRHCPACGRRFEIRVVGKERVGLDAQTGDERVQTPGDVQASMRLAAGGTPFGGALLLAEDVPAMVNEEEFQYSYRCKHCGHQWSEVHSEYTPAEVAEGYKGD